MAWVKQQKKNHLCKLPGLHDFVSSAPEFKMTSVCSLSDVWQCDECDRYWRVVTEKGQFFFQNFTSSDYPTLPRP